MIKAYIPNILTIIRIILTPVFVILLLNNSYYHLIISIIIFSLVNFNIAQLSIDSNPQSIIKKLNQNVPIFTTSELNLQEIIKQDILDSGKDTPYKFGHSFSVDINFFDYAFCGVSLFSTAPNSHVGGRRPARRHYVAYAVLPFHGIPSIRRAASRPGNPCGYFSRSHSSFGRNIGTRPSRGRFSTGC